MEASEFKTVDNENRPTLVKKHSLHKDRILLYEEFRLIERRESEVNGAWKGAHLLLFFLAFIFGSFCTFCFHMLTYMFDEKCVLFPKILSLAYQRHSKIFDFIPVDKDKTHTLPVDFLSTQWVDESVCYLPTYVPLVSGIFGLVWITMLLMCSSGARSHTGLQRPWRVLLPIFVFSLAMGSICFYTSVVTQKGLSDFCSKLSDVTNSPTCSYAINVVTLAYERRISGVYQATRLTIMSAWVNTACWLCSAALVVIRVALAIDFQLVRIKAELIGDIDVMLQRNEAHLHTVSPDTLSRDDKKRPPDQSQTRDRSLRKYCSNKKFNEDSYYNLINETLSDKFSEHILFISPRPPDTSEMSLVPDEENKLARINAYKAVPKNRQFIVRFLYDLIDRVASLKTSAVSISDGDIDRGLLIRTFGQEQLSSKRDQYQMDSTNKRKGQNKSNIKSALTLKDLTERASTSEKSDAKLKVLRPTTNLQDFKTTDTIEKKLKKKSQMVQISESMPSIYTLSNEQFKVSDDESNKKVLTDSAKVQSNSKKIIEATNKTQFNKKEQTISLKSKRKDVNKETQTEKKDNQD